MDSEEFQILWVTDEEGLDTLQSLQMDSENRAFFWTANSTRMLIDLYKKYKTKVGTMEVRNFKAMWEKIATELSNILGSKMLPKNCENRWKVLDRNYKKWVENNNSTGRGRKIFEFSEEMANVFDKKRNINPILLLSTETEHVPEKTNEENTEEMVEINKPKTSKKPTTSRGEYKRETEIRKRKTVLEKIREDRLNYQRERLTLLRQSNKEFLKLQAQRNDILRERNRIEERKNKILKQRKMQ